MSSLWCRWRKGLARRLTILIVPHGIYQPRQISFSVSFTIFLVTFWMGLTGWAGYVASQQLDYWRVKTKSHLLRIKVDYFAAQLTQFQDRLAEVKDMDQRLRSLVGMGSREAIIETPEMENTGGPLAADIATLQTLLETSPQDIDLNEMSTQVRKLRDDLALRLTSFQEVTFQITKDRNLFRHTPNQWPSLGRITSHFGPRLSPFSGQTESHRGVDIAGPLGSPIRATADGVVKLATWAGGYGKILVIDHGYGYFTRYGHNRKILVKRGDPVSRGQTIALMGSTGRSTGPHCHYEVWSRGHSVNPRKLMKRRK
jgi:hypothetical protein